MDLDDQKTIPFSEPSGWQLIDLRHPETKRPTQAFVVVIQASKFKILILPINLTIIFIRSYKITRMDETRT